MKSRLHNLIELPPGKAIGEVLPAYSAVLHEMHIGTPSTVCPGCGKPFNAVRKRRKSIRLYPVDALVPVALQYALCGSCVVLHQVGGEVRAALLVVIEEFVFGEEARQC